MVILLLRHGHAIDEAPGLGDAGRALSGKGRKVTRKVAKWLAEQGKKLRPQVIWTSPLVRAVQTAEIAAEALGLTDSVIVHAELSPDGSPDDVVRLLTDYKEEAPLMLVGHEPSISTIAALLLGERTHASLKKSGIVAVEWEGRAPGQLLIERGPKELPDG